MKFLLKFAEKNNTKFLYLESFPSSPSDNDGWESVISSELGVNENPQNDREDGYERIVSSEVNNELTNLKIDNLQGMDDLEIINKIKSEQDWAFRTFTKDLGDGRYEVNFHGNSFLEDQLSLFNFLPVDKKFVQIERTSWLKHFSKGAIGVRTAVVADEQRLGEIGYQNLDDLGGERNTLKIESGTVFRILTKSEIKKIKAKNNNTDWETIVTTSGEEMSNKQKLDQFLKIAAFSQSLTMDLNWDLSELSSELRAKLRNTSLGRYQKLVAANPNEFRKILIEQVSREVIILETALSKAKTEKERKAILKLLNVVKTKKEEFLNKQKEFVQNDYQKLKNKLSSILKLDEAEKLMKALRGNEGNLDSKKILLLVERMGLSPDKKQKTQELVLNWLEIKDSMNFEQEIEAKNKIAEDLNQIYFDKRFRLFLDNNFKELAKAGIKTSITDILELGNIAKLQMFLKSKERKLAPGNYEQLTAFIAQLQGLETKNLKLNTQISRNDLHFRNLQKTVDNLRNNPQEFFKKITEDLVKKEKNQTSIRNYIGSVPMTAEEKQQSDEMLADLPADVAVAENLGEGRFLVKVGTANANLILDFKKQTMSPEKLPKARKEYVEFPLNARYLVGLQTVAAMQNFMFSGKDKFAKKMEDLAGPESLAKLFFVLFYPRNDVLTKQEENRLQNFGRDLKREGKTFFGFLEEFKKPSIIDNGRIWLQGVPNHKADILEKMMGGEK